MHMHVTAIVYRDSDGSWFASCPGIEGAYVCAGTKHGALDDLREVLRDLEAEGRATQGPAIELAELDA